MDLQAVIKTWWDADPGIIAAGLAPLYAQDEVPDEIAAPYAAIASVEEEATERSTHRVYSDEGFELRMYAKDRDTAAQYLDLFRAVIKDGMTLLVPGMTDAILKIRESRKRFAKEDDGAYRTVWSCQVDIEASLWRLRTDKGILV